MELLRKKIDLVKAFGLAYYKPHEKQDKFHIAGLYHKRRMLRAGNRFGKSTMGCAEDCAWLLRERPWYPEGHVARRGGIPQHPIKLLVITTDWSKVDEIFTSQRGDNEGKIWKFLPKALIKKVKRNHDGVIDLIECTNGSLLRFDTVRSFLNNPQSMESTDWDAIHIDEPCPQQMWKSASRGLIDRHGSAWFTLTPLSEFWINDMFFPEDTRGLPRTGVWAETGTTYDNPHLSPDAIREFERDLSDEEKECRIRGLPLHLSGLIYKQFKWDKHVLKELPEGWTSFSEPPPSYSHYFYIDPHPQTPHCVLFLAVSPQNYRFYYDDIFDHCSTEELAHQVRSKLLHRHTIRGRIDPIAYTNDPITFTNQAVELANHGVYVEKATKALSAGILRVQGELSKSPNIFFSPSARRTLWEIQRYCWDEGENKPIDKDDHAMENLYRAELDDPVYIPLDDQKPLPMRPLIIDRPDLNLGKLSYLTPV